MAFHWPGVHTKWPWLLLHFSQHCGLYTAKLSWLPSGILLVEQHKSGFGSGIKNLHVCACVRACVRACVCACVHASTHVFACNGKWLLSFLTIHNTISSDRLLLIYIFSGSRNATYQGTQEACAMYKIQVNRFWGFSSTHICYSGHGRNQEQKCALFPCTTWKIECPWLDNSIHFTCTHYTLHEILPCNVPTGGPKLCLKHLSKSPQSTKVEDLSQSFICENICVNLSWSPSNIPGYGGRLKRGAREMDSSQLVSEKLILASYTDHSAEECL